MGTFLNAVKNLVNSLTAKTSSTASTADMVQLHDANGNPNGKISLADLASALGARIFRSTALTTGQDLNDCYSDVTYYSNSASVTKSLVNRPEGVTTYGVLLFVLRPYGSSGNYATQILINKSDIYIRLNGGTATEQDWSTWKKVAYETQ